MKKNFEYRHKKTCWGKSCDILDKITSETKWWDQKMPEILSESDLPFHYTSVSDAKIQLQVKNFNTSYDPCLTLVYQLSSANTSLDVSYEGYRPIELTTYVTAKNQWISEEICFNDLVRNIESNFNINLTARMNRAGSDDISIKLTKTLFKANLIKIIFPKEYDYLRHSVNMKDVSEYKNQWPFKFPQGEWNFYTGLLEFMRKELMCLEHI